ncbi:MAG: hypothetical protein FJ098_15185, partial [Deltaproteobacteria bacterium]|nr:hypothetical protein [Deltaproteobacteria bacterium]
MSGPSQAPRRLIWIMAWRLLRSRRGPYLSAVTLVSLAGVVLGVASLLVIFAITSGFEEVFRDKLLGVYPHAIVIGGGADVADYRTVERLAMTAPGVVHAAAATYDQMMISHRGRRAGVLIKGIRREDSPAIRQLRERLSGGDLDGLDASLSLRREGPVVHATRSPGGLDWVVVAWPDGDLEVLPPCVEEIPREDALLRVQVPPGRRITVTLEDPLEAHSLDVAPEDDGRTPWVRVFAGEVLAMVDGTRVVLDVAPGRAWTLAVSGDRWHLAEDRPPRRGDTPSHVSLVNLGREALSLRSGPGTELAIPGGTARVEVAGSFLPGVILGVELAATLGVGSGDEVSLVSPLQGLDRFLRETAGSRPVADTFRVAGLLDLGFYEYDSKLALIDFEQALRFLHRGDRARWVEITTRDLLELEEITRSLEASLASFRLDDLHAASAGMARRTSRILEDLPPPAEPSGGVARAAWLQDLAESLRYGPAELLGLGIRQDA